MMLVLLWLFVIHFCGSLSQDATFLISDENFVYAQFEEGASWNAAQQWCFDNYGSTLATINTYSKQISLERLLLSYASSSTPYPGMYGNIGAIWANDAWQWSDNVTPWSYENWWQSSEATTNPASSCAYMSWNSCPICWRWYPRDCNSDVFYFICNRYESPTKGPSLSPVTFEPSLNPSHPTTQLPTESPTYSPSESPTSYPTMNITVNLTCGYPPDFQDKWGEWFEDEFDGCCDSPKETNFGCYFYTGCADTYNDFCNDNPASVQSVDTSIFVETEFYVCNALSRDTPYTLDNLSNAGRKWIDQMLSCLQQNIMAALQLQFKPFDSVHYTCYGIDKLAFDLHERCYLGPLYSSLVNQSYVSICELNDGHDWDILLSTFEFIDTAVQWRMTQQLLNTIFDCIDKRGYSYVDEKKIYHIQMTVSIPQWSEWEAAYHAYSIAQQTSVLATLYGPEGNIMEVAHTFASFWSVNDKIHAIDVRNDTNATVTVEFVIVTNNVSDVQLVLHDECYWKCEFGRLTWEYLFSLEMYLHYCVQDIKLMSPWLNETNLTYCPTPMPTVAPTPLHDINTDKARRYEMILVVALYQSLFLLLLTL